MSAGAAKSIALPPEILEALGEYRDALKQTKSELKDLERQAKDAERKGVPLSDEVSNRRLRLGARVERLQDRVAQQSRDKAALREASQGIIGRKLYGYERRVDAVRASLSGASKAMRARGMGRAADVLQSASGVAARGGSAISSLAIAAAPLAAPVAALAAVGDGVFAGYKYSRMMGDATIQGAQGEGQVADALNTYAKGVAWGGSQAQDIGRFHAAVMQAQARGAALGAAASLSDRLMSYMTKGYSPTGNDLSTKMAIHHATRQQMIQQHGAIMEKRTSWDVISKTRALEIQEIRDEKYGTIAAAINLVAQKTGVAKRGEYITNADIGSMAARTIPGVGPAVADVFDWFYGGAKAVEVEETKMALETKALAKEMEDRKQQIDFYANDVSKSVERALAHERSNAIRAYVQDKFTRSASWRL